MKEIKYFSNGTFIEYNVPLDPVYTKFKREAKENQMLEDRAIYRNYFKKYHPECLNDDMTLKDEYCDIYNAQIVSAMNFKTLGERGKMQKHYYICSKAKRKIAASTAKMYRTKSTAENICFLTLTFRVYDNKDNVTEKQANVCYSRFMDNLKLNYNVSGYVCVKELTKKGVPHYHLIVRMSYASITDINAAWCKATREYQEFASNAVRTDKEVGMIVRSISRAVKYVAKYAGKNSKSYGIFYYDRCLFISHNVLDNGAVIDSELMDKFLYYCQNNDIKIHVWQSDGKECTIYAIHEFYGCTEDLKLLLKKYGYD